MYIRTRNAKFKIMVKDHFPLLQSSFRVKTINVKSLESTFFTDPLLVNILFRGTTNYISFFQGLCLVSLDIQFCMIVDVIRLSLINNNE